MLKISLEEISIKEGKKQESTRYTLGSTKSVNTSGYNGISYNNPKSDAGWQITISMTRNNKTYMSDQIVISGFNYLKYR